MLPLLSTGAGGVGFKVRGKTGNPYFPWAQGTFFLQSCHRRTVRAQSLHCDTGPQIELSATRSQVGMPSYTTVLSFSQS